MLLFLKSIFAPPVFAGEEKDHLASMLNVMQWLMLGCVLFLAAVGLLAARPDIIPTSLMIGAMVVITMVFSRHGHLFLAALSLLLLTLAAVTVQLSQANGIHDILLLSYLTLIVIASLILSRLFFILFILAELACLAWLIYGELNGIFLTPFSSMTEPSDFFLIGAILLVTALAVRMMADNISRSLQQARTELRERQQAELALRESEETLRLIVEQTGQVVYEVDLASRRGHWYGAVQSLLGYTFEEFQLLATQDWSGLVHPQEHLQVNKLRNEVIAATGQYSLAYHFRHKDGNYLYIEDSGVVLPGEDGQAARIVGVMKDISERKRIEEEIRKQSKRAQVMAEISQALAGMTRDPQQLMDNVLQRCAELLGDGASIFLYDPKEPYLQLASVASLDPEQVKIFRAEIEARPIRADEAAYGRVISTGQPLLFQHIDMEHLKANAPAERRAYYELLPFYSAMFAPLLTEGKVLGVIGMARHHPDHAAYTPDDLNFLQDIAERAAMALLNAQLYATLEERVQQRTAELEAANKELEAFSYSVSHDLRAPLRTIDGFSNLLLSDHPADLDPDARTFIGHIREGAQQMGKLIDDILAFSHLSRHTLQKQPVNLRQIAEESFQNLRNAYSNLQVDFVLADLPTANADSALLRQVFTNLLDNALKYSSKRETARIVLNCYQSEEEITCFVRDNGAGFDMRYVDKLFGVFQRLHRVDEFEGTGIGLANVKRIIERHGGRIWAESVLGQGATFYFTLPVQR